MSRGASAKHFRPVTPDPVYNSKILAKLINRIMISGNKTTAMNAAYKAIDSIFSTIQTEFETANEGKKSSDRQVVVKWFMEEMVNKVAPTIIVKARRIGGSNYQIPIPVNPRKGLLLAIFWIAQGIKKRKERGIVAKIMSEMKDIIGGKGEAMKIKEMISKAAEANRAFAHFANKDKK